MFNRQTLEHLHPLCPRDGLKLFTLDWKTPVPIGKFKLYVPLDLERICVFCFQNPRFYIIFWDELQIQPYVYTYVIDKKDVQVAVQTRPDALNAREKIYFHVNSEKLWLYVYRWANARSIAEKECWSSLKQIQKSTTMGRGRRRTSEETAAACKACISTSEDLESGSRKKKDVFAKQYM